MKRQTGKFQTIKQLLDSYDWDKKKYITCEFQDYGLRLCQEFGDEKHKSLYIKLAKTMPREILEQARVFVKDAYNVRNRAKLFMWKVKQIKNENLKS